MNTTNIGDAAAKAIEIAGGPDSLASKLSDAMGEEIRADTVRKWRYNGVAPIYVLWVTQLTGVPVHELRPEMVLRGARSRRHGVAA